jgi:catechol 2,3-dioxygenase-like lactoylglutathione lyase family enzyme
MTPHPGSGIRGLHHNAYRCRDSEETRCFYEDFLGLPLSAALEIEVTKTGRKSHHLHTFYRLDDGSFLAFFEVRDMPRSCFVISTTSICTSRSRSPIPTWRRCSRTGKLGGWRHAASRTMASFTRSTSATRTAT